MDCLDKGCMFRAKAFTTTKSCEGCTTMMYINNQAMQERKDRHTNGVKMLHFNSINLFINWSDSCNPRCTGSGWDRGSFLHSSLYGAEF